MKAWPQLEPAPWPAARQAAKRWHSKAHGDSAAQQLREELGSMPKKTLLPVLGEPQHYGEID
jgi:hypothetical protein